MSKYSCKGEVAAKCPFYIRESLLSITCEGEDEQTEFAAKFKTQAEKLDWQKKRCFQVHPDCPFYRTAAQKYN
ncbi:MAG: hypothetical protein ACLSF7_13215 [Acutalibacteraceae bacterium]